MHKILPVLPASTEEKTQASLARLVEAAGALEIPIDMNGLAQAWLSDSTRIVIATEEDKPTGMGIMSFGRRYFDANFTASVVLAHGPARKEVLEYLLDTARMLGAQFLFYEAEEGDTLGGKSADMRVVEVN